LSATTWVLLPPDCAAHTDRKATKKWYGQNRTGRTGRAGPVLYSSNNQLAFKGHFGNKQAIVAMHIVSF